MAGMLGVQANIKSSFAERFGHVGIDVFGGQLLQFAGISGQIRPIMGLVQESIQAASGAFGLAAGPLGIAVMALSGIAAIAYKVYEGQHKVAESLEAVTQKARTQFETTDKLTDSFKEYQRIVGELPDDLHKLAAATATLEAAQRRGLAVAEGKLLAAVQSQIAANKENIQTNEATIASLERTAKAQQQMGYGTSFQAGQIKQLKAETEGLRSEGERLGQQYEKLRADIAAQGEGFKDAEDKLSQNAEAHEKAAAAVTKHREALKRLDDIFEDASQGASEISSEFQEIDVSDPFGDLEIDQANKKMDDFMGKLKKSAAEAQNLEGKLGAVGQVGSATFSTIASTTGAAFGQMAAHGKTWTEAFDGYFTKIGERFASMVAEMIAKWLMFQAITAMFPGSAPLAGSLVGVAPGAFGATNKKALGMDSVVDKPTMFMAGESTMERVRVEPISGGNFGGVTSTQGNSSTSISVGQIVVQGSANPAATADAVYEKLVRMVRGRGNVGAVGPGIYGR